MEDSVIDNSKNNSKNSSEGTMSEGDATSTTRATTKANLGMQTTSQPDNASSIAGDNVAGDTVLNANVEASRRYIANSEVVITDLGDELVLMAPASGKMFSLNSSGRTLWQCLPATESELAGALCEAFEVSREDALEDTRVWLEALTKAGLVHIQPPN